MCVRACVCACVRACVSVGVREEEMSVILSRVFSVTFVLKVVSTTFDDLS